MRVRKKNPGSSSHGHVWEEAGQVLDIPAEDAADLVRVAPGEFEVLPDEPETPEDPPPPPSDPVPVTAPVTEPEPPAQPEPTAPDKATEEPAAAEPEPAETKKAPGRRGRRVTED